MSLFGKEEENTYFCKKNDENPCNTMKTYIDIKGQKTDLESLLSVGRRIVTLGRMSEAAYNVVALEDEELDVFQCQFVRSGEGWKVQNGQWRTDCPKGIRSHLQHACSMCMGRCVNLRPARPTYDWQMPERATMVNGVPIEDEEGVELKDGDVIQVGGIVVAVKTETEPLA